MVAQLVILMTLSRGVDSVPELNGSDDGNSFKGPVLPVCHISVCRDAYLTAFALSGYALLMDSTPGMMPTGSVSLEVLL